MPVVKGFRTRKVGGESQVFPLLTGKQATLTEFIRQQGENDKRLEIVQAAVEGTQLAAKPQELGPPAPPSDFKKYSEGAKGWEVSEVDYIEHHIVMERVRLTKNIEYYKKALAELGPNAKKKREEYEMFIRLWERDIKRLDDKDEKLLHNLAENAKRRYFELVKDAIKKGEPVPQAVVEQKPEFQVARDARRRYEKGLHTSFANKSAAVNAVMFLEKGYKVKRQDGKAILPEQIKEIDTGIDEIQQAIGNAKDIMKKEDLTIAHTSGKYPFLTGNAAGIFHPAEKTITMGLKINFFGQIFERKALAHEFAHMLDYAAGKHNEYGYELYSNGRTQKKVKSFKKALSNTERYTNPLYEQAEDTMNNDYEIRKLFRPSLNYGPQTKEEQEAARTMRATIGSYWRDPREIWARLVEQYIAVEHGKETVAAQSPEFYYEHPAYWNKENFEKLRPLVRAEIDRRLKLARGE